MSNEMKDWMADRKAEAEYWISKYPFLRIKNNDIYPWLNTEEIEECWLDCMPEGWARAFGKQMCDDLIEALGDYADEWVIIQVKEKYGELRIYDTGCPSEIYDKVQSIINKYSYISRFVCVRCGSLDARMYDDGWMSPFCEECFTKQMKERFGEDECMIGRFIVDGKFEPTYKVTRFTNDGIVEETVDVSDEWERMKNVERH